MNKHTKKNNVKQGWEQCRAPKGLKQERPKMHSKLSGQGPLGEGDNDTKIRVKRAATPTQTLEESGLKGRTPDAKAQGRSIVRDFKEENASQVLK